MAESSYVYLINPAFQFINVSGKPLVNGYINLYISGTRSKYYAFSDFDGTLHPFNIPLNSLGSAVVLVSPAHSYDVYVYNSLGTLQLSRFNITPATGEGTIITDVTTLTSNDKTVDITANSSTEYNLSIATKINELKEYTDQAKNEAIESANKSIADLDNRKKDKQNELNFNGSATKTVKKITQYPNGELNVEFENIAGGGGPINVAHDGTMTGDGTDESPLSIQSALDVSNANTAPKYDSTAIYPSVGTLCTYGNVLYRSKVAINSAEDWTKEHWEIDSVASELTKIGVWEDISSEFTPTSIVTHINRMTIKINREIGLIYFSIDGNGNFYRDSSVIQLLFTKSEEISNLRFDAQYGIYRNSSTYRYEMPYQLSCGVQGIRGWLPEAGINSDYILVTGVSTFSI